MSSDSSSVAGKATNGARTILGVSGLVALIAGILVLVWPGHTATLLVWILAIYAVVAGLVYLGIGIFSKTMGGWKRVGHIVLGVLYVIAGIIAFVNTQQTKIWLAVFIAIFVGIMWIIEGIVTLTNLGASPSRGWSIFFGILSIVAGIILLSSPLWGALILAVFVWLYVGISLVVLGIVQIVRAFRFSIPEAETL